MVTESGYAKCHQKCHMNLTLQGNTSKQKWTKSEVDILLKKSHHGKIQI